LGILLLTLSMSIIVYLAFDQSNIKNRCEENWIRNILCITTITVCLAINLVVVITYYSLLITKNRKIDFKILLATVSLLLSYCCWDFLTRNEMIEERETVKILLYILIFVILLFII